MELRKQLEEKSDQLSETKKYLEKINDITAKLKSDNLSLAKMLWQIKLTEMSLM